MFGKRDTVGVLMALSLSSSGFSVRAEPGAHQALVGVHWVCWCGGSALVELSQL